MAIFSPIFGVQGGLISYFAAHKYVSPFLLALKIITVISLITFILSAVSINKSIKKNGEKGSIGFAVIGIMIAVTALITGILIYPVLFPL